MLQNLLVVVVVVAAAGGKIDPYFLRISITQ